MDGWGMATVDMRCSAPSADAMLAGTRGGRREGWGEGRAVVALGPVSQKNTDIQS